ncbi:MAG: DMT family transporter [Pseudomonadota bacterium]
MTGLWLSLLTAFMWGTLPVALVLLLDDLDVVTITWARFAFSALCVALLLQRRNQLPSLRVLSGKLRWILAIAVAALLGNFLLYLVGLDLLNPEATQTIIQIAPILLLLGSVYINGERLVRQEWAGAAVLVVGLVLFFNQRLSHLFSALSAETLGVIAMLAAALSWSIYGLLQKRLLQVLSSIQLTLLIYTAGTVVLLLFISPSAILQLSPLQAAALFFCCLNMVLGYGAFTEAMRVWQSAKVSAVIALAPIFTIITMHIAVWGWPQLFASSELNLLAYVGALVVVAGSMLTALGKQAPRG